MSFGFDLDVIARSARFVLVDGLSFTLLLTAMAAPLGLALGTLLALMRLSGSRVLGLVASAYVNLMRALPFLLVIFWFYFLMPYVGQWITGAAQPVKIGAFTSSLVTFVLFEAAFYAEIMRAGIQSVSPGQSAAGTALGLTRRQVLTHIVLPQALRNMAPVLLTQTIILFQDTSLVYVLSITDLLGAASKVAQRDGRLVEMYLFAAVVYFSISFAASLLVRRLEARFAIVR